LPRSKGSLSKVGEEKQEAVKRGGSLNTQKERRFGKRLWKEKRTSKGIAGGKLEQAVREKTSLRKKHACFA